MTVLLDRPWGHHMDDGDHWVGMFGVGLFLLAVLATAVFLVVRSTGSRTATSTPAPQPPAPDPVLQHVRMRYANGEISRDDFLQLTTDLAGPSAPAAPKAPTDPTTS